MRTGNEKTKGRGAGAGLFFVLTFFLVLFLAGRLTCHAYSVELQWDANTEPDVDGYKIYYKTDTSELPFNGTGAEEGSSPVDVHNVTNFTIHGLNPNKKYYVAITAYNTGGAESSYSNIVEIPVYIPSVISIPTLIDNMQTSGSTLTINGTVSDNDGIKSLTINGMAVAVAADGNFSHSLHLAKGANPVTVVVTDNLSFQTVVTRTVILTKSDATADYNGDGRTDFALWRAQYGMWFFKDGQTGTERAVQWGTQGDLTVPGDYDGDGMTDTAVWRASNGTWFVIDSSLNMARTFSWGTQGDIPVPADFDGDGKVDMAVWRPSEGNWYINGSATGSTSVVQWGTQGDIPLTGYFDGDGKADMAVWRPSEGNWYINRSADGTSILVQWGTQGDIPVPGDFDGDGKTDVAVWRPSAGYWYIKGSATGTATVVQWGTQGDIPVPGDFDGDGKTDVAVWRPAVGIWYLIGSATGLQSVTRFGIPTDQPVK
jgi:hypothetical protein